jgi:hypothetical protein
MVIFISIKKNGYYCTTLQFFAISNNIMIQVYQVASTWYAYTYGTTKVDYQGSIRPYYDNFRHIGQF